MNIKEVEEKTSASGQSATLYNFGYTAREVIEKFQHFCYKHPTLEDAIIALLKRDKLLKQKYRFIKAPVTYQMLARPTTLDKPSSVRSAMVLMHKYTKEGKYKSVADAIEELLFGPTCWQKSRSTRVTSNPNDITTLTEVEKDALIKITDVLMLRLAMKENEEKQVKKRKRKSPGSIKKAAGPEANPVILKKVPTPKKGTEAKVNFVPPVAVISKPTNEDSDYSPIPKKIVMLKNSSSDLKEMSLLQNSVIEYNIPPIDIEMVTPLIRLTPRYKIPCKTQSVIRHTCLFGPGQSNKTSFMLNQLELISPVALDLSNQTTSFVVNLDDMGC